MNGTTSSPTFSFRNHLVACPNGQTLAPTWNLNGFSVTVSTIRYLIACWAFRPVEDFGFGDLCFAVSGLMSRISHLSAFRIWVFSLKLGLYDLVLVHAKTWYTERPCQICFFKVGCSSDDQIYFQFRSNSWKQLLWDAAHYVEMKRHLRSRVPFFNRLMFGLLLFVSCFVAALFLLN